MKSANQANLSIKPMSLKEARAVMWLRNNYKPLGQLLDEGYLNQLRLEWAAKKAYDPKLRQAAQVLLDSLKQTSSAPTIENPTIPASTKTSLPPLEIGMTIDQARKTLWPMNPFKAQPMGSLVETKQLSLKDLGYAIEHAWDKRVRLASILLMATNLDQKIKETPPSGQLHVVSSGRSYAERRQILIALVQGVILGAGIVIAFLMVILSIGGIINQSSSTQTLPPMSFATVVAIIIFLALLGSLVWLTNKTLDWVMNKFDAQMENHRKGEKGEDRVVEMMRHILDGNWVLFRNINLPGRNRTDLDSVLVGPSGVWVLEVKTFAGEYRNIGEHWEYRVGNRWKSSKSNPSRQANGNAIRLKNFLKADNISQWVNPVVVWADPKSPLSVENPSVAVWTLDHLQDELGNILQNENISEPNRERIKEKLATLCRRQEEDEEEKI